MLVSEFFKKLKRQKILPEYSDLSHILYSNENSLVDALNLYHRYMGVDENIHKLMLKQKPQVVAAYISYCGDIIPINILKSLFEISELYLINPENLCLRTSCDISDIFIFMVEKFHEKADVFLLQLNFKIIDIDEIVDKYPDVYKLNYFDHMCYFCSKKLFLNAIKNIDKLPDTHAVFELKPEAISKNATPEYLKRYLDLSLQPLLDYMTFKEYFNYFDEEMEIKLFKNDGNVAKLHIMKSQHTNIELTRKINKEKMTKTQGLNAMNYTNDVFKYINFCDYKKDLVDG